jgi:YfiH family protein
MKFHTFKVLQHPAITHAITDRSAGNLARHTGDDLALVGKNRAALAGAFHISADRLIWMDQVHSSTVVAIDTPPATPIAGDALITNQTGLALAVMVADCVPVVLFDPTRHAIGVVHAGWRGTLATILIKAIEAMGTHYGCRPSDIRAGIGPAISGECYEVDEAVAIPWHEALGEKHLEKSGPGHWLLDLPGANYDQLLRAGLKPENIETMAICTHCDDRFFSYRRGREMGRFAGVIALKEA